MASLLSCLTCQDPCGGAFSLHLREQGFHFMKIRVWMRNWIQSNSSTFLFDTFFTKLKILTSASYLCDATVTTGTEPELCPNTNFLNPHHFLTQMRVIWVRKYTHSFAKPKEMSFVGTVWVGTTCWLQKCGLKCIEFLNLYTVFLLTHNKIICRNIWFLGEVELTYRLNCSFTPTWEC